MWWFAASHTNLLLAYRQTAGDAGAATPLLDAGCGTGGLLAHIAAAYRDRPLIGVQHGHRRNMRHRVEAERSIDRAPIRKSGQPVQQMIHRQSRGYRDRWQHEDEMAHAVE